MARPERHDVDYFPFMAKRGKTLNILQSRYGLEGIGFFTNLLRFLAFAPDHHCCIKEELDMLNFFAEIGLSNTEKGLAIIELMVKTEKLDRDLWENHKVIVCPAFLDSIKDAYDRRSNPIITLEEIRAKFQNTAGKVIVSENTENAAAGGVTVAETATVTPQDGVFDDNNPQTKLKESKLNNNKGGLDSENRESEKPPPANLHNVVSQKTKACGYYVGKNVVGKIAKNVPDPTWITGNRGFIEFVAEKISKLYPDKEHADRERLFVNALTNPGKWDSLTVEFPDWLSAKIRAEKNAPKPARAPPPKTCPGCEADLTECRPRSNAVECRACGGWLILDEGKNEWEFQGRDFLEKSRDNIIDF